MSQDIESCPQCGADDYETHRPHWADGVAPFKPFCECRCGATWDEDQPPAQPAPVQETLTRGSKEHLKVMMEESAFEGRLKLSDALANIDEFYAAHGITKGQ